MDTVRCITLHELICSEVSNGDGRLLPFAASESLVSVPVRVEGIRFQTGLGLVD